MEVAIMGMKISDRERDSDEETMEISIIE